MSEKDIETYLRDRVRGIGGKAYKLSCMGTNGMPDRLLCLPGGRAVFVETKATGKKPRPLQTAQHRVLRSLGFPVYGSVDSREAVDLVIEACRGMIGGNVVPDETSETTAP